MPPRPWWTIDEARLLIDLYREEGLRPSESAVGRLRELLLEWAAPEFRRDPSYRSVGSIRSQLSWVHFLATEDPRSRHAPMAFRIAWDLYQKQQGPLVDKLDVAHSGAAADRRALIGVLEDLRATLEELVESPDHLPSGIREYYAAAWADLEERGYIDQAITALTGPAVDDLLAAHGLVGPQRVAKTESVSSAVRERRRRPGRGPLKALLGYFDSILGSLTSVLPWLDVVQEFKEIGEASVELASETGREDEPRD
jgi:hypothetical protein